MPQDDKREPAFIHPAAIVGDARMGDGVMVWAHAVIMDGATVGAGSVICSGCLVEGGAVLGRGVKLKNGVQVWDGVQIGDFSFVGPNATFTNDLYPRSWVRPPEWSPTRLGRGVSVGAGAVILCGTTIGDFATIGAGAVVTRNVKPHQLVVGNPARHAGWVCVCGIPLDDQEQRCLKCGGQVSWDGNEILVISGSAAEPS